MKEIFDWLREQTEEHLNHCKQMAEQSIYFSEEIGYCSRADAYEIALGLINEAEAKWESDCCEWSPMKYLEFSLSDCLTSCGHAEHYSTGIDKYCRHCGKPIKIVEVE